MKTYLSLTLFLVFSFCGFAQEITGTLRGTIIDKDFQYPLPGATVALYKGDSLIKGASSDGAGMYIIQEIPVGR